MRFLTLLFLPHVAMAAPVTFGWTGVLTDPTGEPIQGSVDLTIRLLPDADATHEEAVFSEVFADVIAHDGHVSVVLGGGDVLLDAQALGPDTAWLQVSIDGGDVGAPQPLTGSLGVYRALRVGPANAGLYADADGITADGGLRVDGNAALDAVGVGGRHVLTVDGTTCTNRDWVVEVAHPAQAMFLDVRMNFSHCGGGCHYAYRHWTGYLDAESGTIQVENVARGAASGGSWTMTRLAPSADGTARTRFQKTRDNRYSWCGDVDLWMDSSQPVELVSQTPY